MVAGNPPRCRIIELGPGRGTLMADILRVSPRVPRDVEEHLWRGEVDFLDIPEYSEFYQDYTSY
jgi:hypothetical protein